MTDGERLARLRLWLASGLDSDDRVFLLRLLGEAEAEGDVMERAEALATKIVRLHGDAYIGEIARALTSYGDQRAREAETAMRDKLLDHADACVREARATAFEEAAKVCDMRSEWAEAHVEEPDTGQFGQYSNACDDCAEMIRGDQPRPSPSDVYRDGDQRAIRNKRRGG